MGKEQESEGDHKVTVIRRQNRKGEEETEGKVSEEEENGRLVSRRAEN